MNEWINFFLFFIFLVCDENSCFHYNVLRGRGIYPFVMWWNGVERIQCMYGWSGIYVEHLSRLSTSHDVVSPSVGPSLHFYCTVWQQESTKMCWMDTKCSLFCHVFDSSVSPSFRLIVTSDSWFCLLLSRANEMTCMSNVFKNIVRVFIAVRCNNKMYRMLFAWWPRGGGILQGNFAWIIEVSIDYDSMLAE